MLIKKIILFFGFKLITKIYFEKQKIKLSKIN